MDDYIQQRSDMMVLKNFLNIDVPNNKKYKFTEEDLKNHAKYGIMFAKNFDELNKGDRLADKLLTTEIVFKKK